MRQKVDQYQMDGDYVKASKLLYQEIPNMEKKIDDMEK